jgi:hypothetical protein
LMREIGCTVGCTLLDVCLWRCRRDYMYREALLGEVRRAALDRIRNGWRNIFVFVTRPVATQLKKSFESPSIATSNFAN